MNLFDFEDYKQYLRTSIDSHQGARGLIRQMAEAAGCQRSYISQVIASHVHLTKDQAFGLCGFWNFNSNETEFFLILVELARCSQPAYSKFLQSKLKNLKREEEDLAGKIGNSRVGEIEKESIYYSSWLNAVAHIGVSVPEYQDVRTLALRLGVPEDALKTALEMLEKLELVKRERGKWTLTGEGVHVPSGSPWVVNHHNNWRQRAILDAQARNPESLHYTMIQTMTPQAFEKIRKKLVNFIDEANRIASPSEPREIYVLCCDAFRAI